MPNIAIIEKADGRTSCIHCEQAKEYLAKREMPFELCALQTRTIQAIFPQAKTVPVVVIDGIFVGGFSELKRWHENGDIA